MATTAVGAAGGGLLDTDGLHFTFFTKDTIYRESEKYRGIAICKSKRIFYCRVCNLSGNLHTTLQTHLRSTSHVNASEIALVCYEGAAIVNESTQVSLTYLCLLKQV